MKESIAEKTKERWHGKRIHGQFPCNLDGKLVDIEQSYRYLKSVDSKGETESTVGAAQDQAISTNYFKNKISKEEIENKCRLCKQDFEQQMRNTWKVLKCGAGEGWRSVGPTM